MGGYLAETIDGPSLKYFLEIQPNYNRFLQKFCGRNHD